MDFLLIPIDSGKDSLMGLDSLAQSAEDLPVTRYSHP